jgi:hypothetical protein
LNVTKQLQCDAACAGTSDTKEVMMAAMILKYIDVLVWPVFVFVLLLVYRGPILRLLEFSKVKLTLFGTSVETTIADLQKVMTAEVSGTLTSQQWMFLEDLWSQGQISVADRKLRMTMYGDLNWIRPIRNVGLIKTLPDNDYIENATHIELTPLGRLLMAARKGKHLPVTSESMKELPQELGKPAPNGPE